MECGVCGRRIYSSDSEHRARAQRLGALWINFLADGVGSTQKCRTIVFWITGATIEMVNKGVTKVSVTQIRAIKLFGTRQPSSLESIFPPK